VYSFSDRLRAEIEYAGLTQKEFAAKAGIKKRSLDGYLGSQKSLPLADVAVKIASALGVSVEYLVTGKDAHYPEPKYPRNMARYMENCQKYRNILDDMADLSENSRGLVRKIIKTVARHDRLKQKRHDGNPPTP
jgi:transcriptional regulator with XRE-family HTH domain